MKIERVHTDSPLLPALRNFVEKHALVFHSPEWLACYEGSGLVQCAMVNNNNEVIGCFLYYVFRKYGFQFVITPPFTPSIELFYLNPAASVVGKNSFTKDVMTELASYFDKLKAHFNNLHLPDGIVDAQPFVWRS